MQSRAREEVAAIAGLLPTLWWMHKLLTYLSGLQPVSVSWKKHCFFWDWVCFFCPPFSRLIGMAYWDRVFLFGWLVFFVCLFAISFNFFFSKNFIIFNSFIMSEIYEASILLPSLGLFNDIALVYSSALSEREKKRICQHLSHFWDFLTDFLRCHIVWMSDLEWPKQGTFLQTFLDIIASVRSFCLDNKN